MWSLHPRSREAGESLAGFALIIPFLIIVAIIALIFLGQQVSTILSSAGSSLNAPLPMPS